MLCAKFAWYLAWNPHSDAYTKNEDTMVEFENNMIESTDRIRILVSDLENDEFCWNKFVNTCVIHGHFISLNNIDMEIRDVNPILDHSTLSQL